MDLWEAKKWNAGERGGQSGDGWIALRLAAPKTPAR